MRHRRLIYCDTAFIQQMGLDKPFAISPNRTGGNEEMSKIGIIGRLMLQFLAKSDLLVDSIQDFRALAEVNSESPLFLLFKWNDTGGGGKGQFIRQGIIPNVSEFLKNKDYLNAIILTGKLDDKSCRSISRDLGIIVFNPNLMNIGYVNLTMGKAIPTQAIDWSWLAKQNETFPRLDICNSMIIIDPYILQDRINQNNNIITYGFDEKINNNLEPILNQLLPQSLGPDIKFHIDLFVNYCNDWNKLDWNERYNYVRDTIEYIRPKLDFSLAIYGTKSFHDRMIITNNIFIESGEGFDIFPNPKPTRVSIEFPFIQTNNEWLDDHMLQLMEKAVTVYKNPKTKRYGDHKRLNRIVKYYTS